MPDETKLLSRFSRAQKIAAGVITALAGLAGAVALFLDEIRKLFGG